MDPSQFVKDIKERFDEDMSEDEVQEALRLLYLKYARKSEVFFRWTEIADAVHNGETHASIGRRYGFTKARTSQVYIKLVTLIRDEHALQRIGGSLATTTRRRYSNGPIPR